MVRVAALQGRRWAPSAAACWTTAPSTARLSGRAACQPRRPGCRSGRTAGAATSRGSAPGAGAALRRRQRRRRPAVPVAAGCASRPLSSLLSSMFNLPIFPRRAVFVPQQWSRVLFWPRLTPGRSVVRIIHVSPHAYTYELVLTDLSGVGMYAEGRDVVRCMYRLQLPESAMDVVSRVQWSAVGWR
jgi:hypothetical protein